LCIKMNKINIDTPLTQITQTLCLSMGMRYKAFDSGNKCLGVMEQHTLKIVSNCLNSNMYSYLETSGGQSSILYLNVVHFFITSVIFAVAP
jgi:hypothetical protein